MEHPSPRMAENRRNPSPPIPMSDTAAPSRLNKRMAELGLCAGCRLQMVRGGCPCLFQLGGTRLSLRGEDVMRIMVRPLAC